MGSGMGSSITITDDAGPSRWPTHEVPSGITSQMSVRKCGRQDNPESRLSGIASSSHEIIRPLKFKS